MHTLHRSFESPLLCFSNW